MPLSYDPVDQLATDGAALLATATATATDLRASIAACPGWDLGDLVYHVGEVWASWARVVGERITDASFDEHAVPPRPADTELVAWARSQLDHLTPVLRAADGTQPAWTWTGATRDVEWVRRGMAQETLVHRWDAERATGCSSPMPPAVASDGID